MTKKRFRRFLLDGNFSFGDEYIAPVWAIEDSEDKESPVFFLEFQDENIDLCDKIVDFLNDMDSVNKIMKDNVFTSVETTLKFHNQMKQIKKEKRDIEFQLNVLKKWYLCPHCAFNNREFKYLRGLKHEREETC